MSKRIRLLPGLIILVAGLSCNVKNASSTTVQPRNDCHAALLAQARYLAGFIHPSTNPKRPHTLSIDLSAVVLPPDIMEQSMVYKGYQTIVPINQEIGKYYMYYRALYALVNMHPLEGDCRLNRRDILAIFGRPFFPLRRTDQKYTDESFLRTDVFSYPFNCQGDKPTGEGTLLDPTAGCKELLFILDDSGYWIDVNPGSFIG